VLTCWDSSHFSLAVILNPMAWAHPSSAGVGTKVYHLCSLGRSLPETAKDDILQALSVVAQRVEWAGKDSAEPRSVPEQPDLVLVSNRCSWKEVSVGLLKKISGTLLFLTHLPHIGSNPEGWCILRAPDNLQCTCVHATRLCDT
jgi:hypothetical protein